MKAYISGMILPVLLVLLAGCRADRAATYPPVTAAQLAGCHYSPEASGGIFVPQFQWSFEPKDFRITAGADPIPHALLAAILGVGIPAREVEGRWAIEGSDLILFGVNVDGKAVRGTARLHVWNTGVMRVSLPADGNAQYAFSRRVS